jgi:DNA-binding transcriptional MerR regulator
MKTPNALKTIGEVSKIIDVPIYVIRFWEKKFSALCPIKKNNGIRYYSNYHQEVLLEIRSLLYEKKFSIDGANQILKEKKKEDLITKKLINEIEGLIIEIKSKLL